ncbi:MAG: hypothetical protein ACI9OJ_002019 [Myxococcota bacterium]|jgi:hypothetical protein
MKQPKITEMVRRFKNSVDPQVLTKLGGSTGFVKRERTVTAESMAVALLCAFSCHRVQTLADLHRTFQAVSGRAISYKPFHNQLAKTEFPEFTRQVLCHLVSSLAMRVLEPLPQSVLARFDDILIQDGTPFAVHDALADRFPGRFTAFSPAAVELHVTMSLLDDRPVRIALAPDKEGERQFLPAPHTLRRKLVMADRGYDGVEYCRDVDAAGGHSIIRFKSAINPIIRFIDVPESDPLHRLQGRKFKDVRKQFWGRNVDLDGVFKKRGTPIKLRAVLTWNPQLKQHRVLMTNLGRDEAPLDVVRALYRLRWQVELLFKEWKSYANLHRFATTKAPIAEGLLWIAIAAAVLKRFFAHATQRLLGTVAISTRIAAMAANDFIRDLLVARGHATRLRRAFTTLVQHLARVAPRDHPKRDKKTGRLAMRLTPLTDFP